MIRGTRKRLVMSVLLPLLCLLSYWQSLHGNYSTYQLLLASAIAILAGAGLFLYTTIVRMVESAGKAWGLFWIAATILGAIGLTGVIGAINVEPWGLPLVFFTIWAPIYYKLCTRDDGKVKLSFFKAPQKSQCN